MAKKNGSWSMGHVDNASFGSVTSSSAFPCLRRGLICGGLQLSPGRHVRAWSADRIRFRHLRTERGRGRIDIPGFRGGGDGMVMADDSILANEAPYL